ncbi:MULTISPECIES: MATE family efflux transporter [Halolamina]|uniref:Multidrug-efflux transporter n=1 Tax=Halolamina pelagica TaxID=699431 RepID=A0A1I5MMQ8_9EURY|nr:MULTISPECIES: MATE family efflux transporter [Halolamina]NHX36088.1 MATE family efflux transporter [Halolamina sp. R1-12]SFP10810.1 putative efflux protein, MATE family [Halolamina pelagica]
MSRTAAVLRLPILYIGLALARAGLIDRERAVETADLAWPRIVTGVARMSKNAADVAMVGAVLGADAIAGVGVAGPFWGLAFAIGGGVAGGTIALVSQRYGADAYEQLGLAVRSSALLVIVVSLPVVVVFWLFPTELVGLINSDPTQIEYGARYLRIVGLGIPFAGLNLVGSRVLVGADDAYTAMQVRAGGAVVNIVLNAVFIIVLGWGVAGAALGTVLSNVFAVSAFAFGLSRGSAPGFGQFPVEINPVGTYVDGDTLKDLVRIGTPVGARNLVWTAAEFPMLAILGTYRDGTLAAFVVARRIWGIMNTPGWGFGLASSSLTGQALGQGKEALAEAYGRDIIRFSVATYAVSALIAAVFARPMVSLFINPDSPPATEPIAVSLIYAACVAMLFRGISGSSIGPLDASGDTRVPFLSQLLGMFGASIPLIYIGSVTPLGIWGVYLAFIAETTVPAAVNYWRFNSGKWKEISREIRPEQDDASAVD